MLARSEKDVEIQLLGKQSQLGRSHGLDEERRPQSVELGGELLEHRCMLCPAR